MPALLMAGDLAVRRSQAYTVVFHRGIQLAAQADTLQARVHNLIDSITYQTYIYTSRGLFEADKLIFMTQMAVQVGARPV